MRGQCPVVALHGKLVCMKPKEGQSGYSKRKLDELNRNGVKFFCVNSLDKASESERKILHAGLAKKLGIELPSL